MPGARPLIKLAPSRRIHITAATQRTYKLFGPHNEGGGKWTGSLRSCHSSSSGFYLRRDALAETPGHAAINLALRRNFKCRTASARPPTRSLLAAVSILYILSAPINLRLTEFHIYYTYTHQNKCLLLLHRAVL